MPTMSFLKRTSRAHDNSSFSTSNIGVDHKPKSVGVKASQIISMLPKDLQFRRLRPKSNVKSCSTPGCSIQSNTAHSSDSTLIDPTSVNNSHIHNTSPVSSIVPSIVQTSSNGDHNTRARPLTPPNQVGVIAKAPTAFELAMKELHEAQKLLEQRHANIKTKADNSKKPKPAEKDASQVTAPSRNPHFRSFSADSPHRDLPHTANEAAVSRRRRELIKQVAYDAYYHHCPAAIRHMQSIVARFVTEDRYPEHRTPNVYVNVKGTPIDVSQMGIVERNWAQRLNTCIFLHKQLERRGINSDEHELIVGQLVPQADPINSFWNIEYFEIFLDGLTEEGYISAAEAKDIARLAVSHEEYEAGSHFTGISAPLPNRPNHAKYSMFQMPTHDLRGEIYQPHAVNIWAPDLDYHITLLVQAAVYKREHWRGQYFPDARKELKRFYEAWQISSQDKLLPPFLTPYKRHWRTHNLRTLKRGYLICCLLDAYEAGKIKDFGIIAAVRGSLVHIQGQRLYTLEDLESFLFHRVNDSGFPVTKIPEILAMHITNDEYNMSPLSRALVESYKVKTKKFLLEEEERLSAIESSKESFEMLLKAEMNPWQRVKAKCKKVFGKKMVVVPFDPFSPEHDVKVE